MGKEQENIFSKSCIDHLKGTYSESFCDNLEWTRSAIGRQGGGGGGAAAGQGGGGEGGGTRWRTGGSQGGGGS